MTRYRLGVVPYLNAKPLVDHFERRPRADIAWTVEVPSRLVDRLRAGELDAALVSSVACFEAPPLVIVPGVCIAARERVESVCLFCKVPPDRLRRVALDSSSRAGSALLRVALAEAHGLHPEYVEMPPDLSQMLACADAGLLIGDPALRAFYGQGWQQTGASPLDLCQVWHSLTGLPFVFAVWAARGDADVCGLAALLAEAWQAGRARLDAIADAEARRLDLPADVCRRYLRDVMVYELGHREMEGLRRFRELAIRHGVLPPDAPPPVLGGE